MCPRSPPGRNIVGSTMTESVPVPSGSSPEDPLRELQLQDPAVRAKVKEILADAAHGKDGPCDHRGGVAELPP